MSPLFEVEIQNLQEATEDDLISSSVTARHSLHSVPQNPIIQSNSVRRNFSVSQIFSFALTSRYSVLHPLFFPVFFLNLSLHFLHHHIFSKFHLLLLLLPSPFLLLCHNKTENKVSTTNHRIP